jgi:hypothetical protein
VRNAGTPFCPLLDRYADQKVWNQFLASEDVELLPLNYNCNSKYLSRHLFGVTHGLSIVHFAGPKPWMTWPWMVPSSQYLAADDTFSASCLLWNDRYCRLLAEWRLREYRAVSAAERVDDYSSAAIVSESLQALSFRSSENASLHWLVADPELLGGFFALEGTLELPVSLREKLSAFSCLHVWLPFELEPLLRSVVLPSLIRLHWLLIEPLFISLPVDPGASALSCAPISTQAMAHMVRQRLAQVGCQTELIGLP